VWVLERAVDAFAEVTVDLVFPEMQFDGGRPGSMSSTARSSG